MFTFKTTHFSAEYSRLKFCDRESEYVSGNNYRSCLFIDAVYVLVMTGNANDISSNVYLLQISRHLKHILENLTLVRCNMNIIKIKWFEDEYNTAIQSSDINLQLTPVLTLPTFTSTFLEKLCQ